MNRALQAMKKTRKKTTKKSTVLTYKKFTTMLKDGKNTHAFKAILHKTDNITRVKFISEVINTSMFQAYPQALKKFNTIINMFLKNGDTTPLQQYLNELENAVHSPEANYAIFSEIRFRVIQDLLDSDPNSLLQAFYLIFHLENKNYEVDYEQERARELAANLAERVWPDKAKGLKVLYGL